MTTINTARTGHRGFPTPDTPVLADRRLNPNSRQPPSVFADDWWDITPGLFEAHIPNARMSFTAVPDRFRDGAKHYIWQLINHDDPNQRTTRGRRLALRSIALALPRLAAFLHWLDAHDIARVADVTAEDLDAYAAAVAALEATAAHRRCLLVEVRRLWSYQSLLPDDLRLPQAPPWGDDRPSNLVGGAKHSRENLTPRLAADTTQTLLMWCLRLVEDFADDIVTAYHEYLHLWGRSPSARNKAHGYTAEHTSTRQAESALRSWLQRLHQAGDGLPSRPGPDGQQRVDWAHLCRLFDIDDYAFRPQRPLRRLVEDSRLPLTGPALLDTPITGRLHDRPWRTTRIRYDEAAELARALSTAAAVVIAYLTGMRTGEVLNLERGCAGHDPVTGLWFVTGKHWKTARDHHGNKIPEGEQRPDPWTTIQPVAHAITALERLHPHQLLFSAELHPARIDQTHARPEQHRQLRFGQGRTARDLTRDISNLIKWINNHCARQSLPDQRIPADPHGPVTGSRFRRTLAWHIVRRPRGLVAGAIQYGHLHVQITLGYAVTYDSGFPDEHAYEDWLSRLDDLADNHRQLTAGEHVSGPAADTYRHRVNAAHNKFAGRVLTNPKHAHDLVTNPLLQIFPGRGMTCVFDPTKALCQLRPAEHDVRRTPDQDDCRPTCQNIAYTDRNIADIRRHAAQLHDLVNDHLAPSPRHHRERAELDRLRAIIRHHDHGK